MKDICVGEFCICGRQFCSKHSHRSLCEICHPMEGDKDCCFVDYYHNYVCMYCDETTYGTPQECKRRWCKACYAQFCAEWPW